MVGLCEGGNEPTGSLRATSRCTSRSILAPFLYLIYTHDIPTPKSDSLTVAQFADDIAVLSKGDTGEQVTTILQNFLQEIEIWNKKWRTVMNTNKSSTPRRTLEDAGSRTRADPAPSAINLALSVAARPDAQPHAGRRFICSTPGGDSVVTMAFDPVTPCSHQYSTA
ncbi:hypothetical protein ANN_15022 [Periplaneta americana]|uniref:Reverse transcriptase domain-containing protein n=1 Tax=Periplaneta americana TaxID=6978 RepID=A0ABQ8SZB6_PERAM|nr:hypothetical protein ANN_15022 [Periplaneta americana]